VPLFEVDVLLVASCQRIFAKLSIISFLYRSRDSSRKILIVSLVLSYLFSPTMDGFFGV
jgi:hypothetical protein